MSSREERRARKQQEAAANAARKTEERAARLRRGKERQIERGKAKGEILGGGHTDRTIGTFRFGRGRSRHK